MAQKHNISKIYSYLINPGKGSDTVREIAGTDIPPVKGSMYDMLESIYGNTAAECKIRICFSKGEDGKQENPVKDEVVALLQDPTQERGLLLAKRLQEVTTGKSGLALLFLSIGKNASGEPKVVISRFPADQGILADTNKGGLTVEFVEKVFMKNSHAYKSAVYEGASYDSDFWEGYAVDRQINSSASLANYWIRHFLQSDFKITAKEGTKLLAVALKAVSASSDANGRAEVVAAMQLAKNLNGDVLSVSEIAGRFSLSKPIKDALIKALPHPEIADHKFQFDLEEFSKHVSYVSKEISNGGILTAPTDVGFDEIFITEKVGKDGEFEFKTRGYVVSQRLRNRKS